MKIIIPMAGLGKRMRPHTLTIPKPLIRIAGKPIVQRLVEDIIKVSNDAVDEIAFIIGDFGKEVEEQLLAIAQAVGAKGSIYYQEEALGTAHAILCAEASLKGNITVAFADTLFKASFQLNQELDSVIWVQRVKNPELFGVVKTNDKGCITDFIEKPDIFVSDLAIIGIYYFRSGEYLKEELQFLIDNHIVVNGEYQLTDALQNMMKNGTTFHIDSVDEWLDCGNKDATVFTHQRILEHQGNTQLIPENLSLSNSKIIEPCYIGNNVSLKNATIGPYVSIDDNCVLEDVIIENSMVGKNSKLLHAEIKNSMLGNNIEYSGVSNDLSIGDYSTIR
ncbi:MAG: sugar phosphate nucleotidyltransferase [Bacteroidota bacterium]